MANQIELGGTKVSRNKLIAVGLLACLLVVVLFRSKGTAPSSDLTSICDAYPPQAGTPAVIEKNLVAEQPPLPLPNVDLSVVVANDPFRSRSAIEPKLTSPDHVAYTRSGAKAHENPASSVVRSEIEQAEIPISAIITGGNRAVALIGEKLYYENDVLDNGWHIVAIKSNSILVANAVVISH